MRTELFHELSAQATQVLPALADAAFKGVILLALTAVALRLIRRTAASVRHMVWVLAMCGLIVLPVLSSVLPGWKVLPGWTRIEFAPAAAAAAPPIPAPTRAREVPAVWMPPSRDLSPAGSTPLVELPPASESEDSAEAGNAPVAPSAIESVPRSVPAAEPMLPESLLPWIYAIWLAGMLVCLIPLMLGRISLWRLARSADRVKDGPLAGRSRRAGETIGLKRPVILLKSHRRTMPMVWGVFRPRVLLPAEAETWTSDRCWVVLLHELAHVKRRDCLAKLVAHLACAVYWFNPLCWFAFRLMQREAETACDDLVLCRGNAAATIGGDESLQVRPGDYAEHLLEIAAGLQSGMLTASSSIAMARPSKLEGRLLAIMDGRRNRRALTRWGFLILAMITASTALAVSLMKAHPVAGITARSDDRLARGATILGVRPDGGAAIYDADGNATDLTVEHEPGGATWPAESMRRDFILQLPASDPPIQPTGPVMISRPGEDDMLTLVEPKVVVTPDGRQLVILPSVLPRELPRGGLLPGSRQLEAVDFTLRYFHGPRGRAEQTFTGPFAAGETLQSGPVSLSVTIPSEGPGSPTAEFEVSVPRHMSFGTPLTVYDKSGKAHPVSYGGGSRSPESTSLTFRLYGLELDKVARVAFNEGFHFIVCRNVCVSGEKIPAGLHAAHLDRIAERLGLPPEKATEICEHGFPTPADAVKCIDLVRGQTIRSAWQSISSGEPRLKLPELSDRQKDALAEAAVKWATGPQEYRAYGVLLGLWCRRSEFITLGTDLFEGGIAGSHKQDLARSIGQETDLVTDEQIGAITRLLQTRDDRSLMELRKFLIRLAMRGGRPAAERAARELAESDKPWLWRPAVARLAASGKLGDRAGLSHRMRLRLIAVTEAEPEEKPLEAEAITMVGDDLTPQHLGIDGETFRDSLRWYASRADKSAGTRRLVETLRRLVDDWDTYQFSGWASNNPYGVDGIVRYLNLWNDVNIGGLGSDVTRLVPDSYSFDWKATALEAIRWSRTRVDPAYLPVAWKPGAGDVRVVWKDLADSAASVIAVPAAPGHDPEPYLVLAREKDGGSEDMLNVRQARKDGAAVLEVVAGVTASHSSRREFPLAGLPMRLPLGPELDNSTELWKGSWEVWVEPAGAPGGCLAGTEFFERWKGAYLAAGGTQGPLKRVVGRDDMGILTDIPRAKQADKSRKDETARGEPAGEGVVTPGAPFERFTVSLASTWPHNRTITILPDGSYRFEMQVLEKVPGKDYFRGAKDPYVATFRLSAAHLRELEQRLVDTGWLSRPAREERNLEDAVRYRMTVTRGDKTSEAVCYGKQDEAYENLARFLRGLDNQEWLLYQLLPGHPEGDGNAAHWVHIIHGEVRGVLGAPHAMKPYAPALDYTRLLPALQEVAERQKGERRAMVGKTIEAIRKLAARPAHEGGPEAALEGDVPDTWQGFMDLVYRENIPLLGYRAIHVAGDGRTTVVALSGDQDDPLLGRHETILTKEDLDALAGLLNRQQAWALREIKQETAWPDEPTMALSLSSAGDLMTGEWPLRTVRQTPALLAIQQAMVRLMEKTVAAPKAAQEGWGPLNDEGFQSRLRADSASWKAGETPTFKAGVRNLGMRVDLMSETMQNIICGPLRQKCPARLCLENLDFDMAKDGVTIEQAIRQLEEKRKLTLKERDRLSLARKLLSEGKPKTMLFDVGTRYSGQYRADSVDELLTRITRDTPYAWRKIGDTFVVLPAAGSRLGYPVTLGTKGLTVAQAVQKVVEQQPADSHISMVLSAAMPVKEGEDPMPWLSAKAPTLELKGIPALEALCRITAGARPDSVWELAGYKEARHLGISRGPNAPQAPASVPPASQFTEGATVRGLAAGRTTEPEVVMPAGLPVAAETKGPGTQIESEVLRAELFNLCDRMIAAQKQTGQPMPEPAEVDARKKWILDQCAKAVPGFLKVTREQEKRFSEGKFDDRIAKERMRKTLKLLGDLGAELPVMCVFIVKEFDAGRLSGGQLEIANRVMLGPVHAMVQPLQDDKASPDAESRRNLLQELPGPRPGRTNRKDAPGQTNGLDPGLREGKNEKPFTTFSVELTSPELHNRTIAFKEDGGYTFRMNVLEKVPGKDYYRESKDQYVARHRLASRDLRQLNKLIQETKWLAAPGKQDEGLRDGVRYALAVVHDGQNGQAVCYGNQEKHYTDLVAFLQKVDRQEWWLYNLKRGERVFLHLLGSHLDEVVKKGVEPRVLDFGRLTEAVRTLSATGTEEQTIFARKVFEKLDTISGQTMRARLVGVWKGEGSNMRLVIKENGSFEWTHAGPPDKWRATGDWDVSGQTFRKKFVQSPQKPEWVGQASELIIHQLTADTLVLHTGDDPNLSIGVTRYKRVKEEQ